MVSSRTPRPDPDPLQQVADDIRAIRDLLAGPAPTPIPDPQPDGTVEVTGD